MKLNGWHRLWILLSSVYFVVVTSYVIMEFPKAENISHKSEFYKKLPKKAALMIIPATYQDALALDGKDIPLSIADASNESPSIAKLSEIRNKHPEYNDMTDQQLADTLYLKYYSDMPKNEYYKRINLKEIPAGHLNVEMPNGHIITFNTIFSKKELECAAKEYWGVVEQKATEKRLHLLLYVSLFWLVPCLLLYALGWSVNWVHMGFKQKKDTQQLNRGDR